MDNGQDPFQINNNAHREGITKEEMIQCYDNWAEKYDDLFVHNKFAGPEITANFLVQAIGSKSKNIRIIDIAAGTGRVGEELKKLGFTNIDAVEPSMGMLEIAKKKNIYVNLFPVFINSKPLDIPDDTYDALVICGGMGEGHIPTEACIEMIRIVKPGGIVLITMREEYLTKCKDYNNRLEPYMAELEKMGKWKMKSRTIVPKYSFQIKNGVVFIFEVL